jgi:hypothetical protein
MKICSKCGTEKELIEFGPVKRNKDGLSCVCKKCYNVKQQTWRDANREHVKKLNTEQKRIKRKENPEKYLQYNKEYYAKNRDAEINRSVNYQNNNKLKVHKTRNKRFKERFNNDILFRIKITCRNRLKKFLKSKNLNLNNGTFKMVGCTQEELKLHLELQFDDKMSWCNYGYFGWHIDHIIPLDSAKTEADVYKLSHYTNLQPLWFKDNYKKGNKILING